MPLKYIQIDVTLRIKGSNLLEIKGGKIKEMSTVGGICWWINFEKKYKFSRLNSNIYLRKDDI